MKNLGLLSTVALLLLCDNTFSSEGGSLTEAQAFRATCEAFDSSSPSQDPLVLDFLSQFCASKPLSQSPVEIVIGQLDGVGEIERICQSNPALLAIQKVTPCGRERITQEHLKNTTRPNQSDNESLRALASLQQAVGIFNTSQTKQFLQSLGKSTEQIDFGIIAIEVMHETLQAAIRKLLNGEMTWGEFNRLRLHTRSLADTVLSAIANTPSNNN